MDNATKLIVLNHSGEKEVVLENAYDIILTGEINGIDTLEFNLPFQDSKRQYLENEKQIKVGEDFYRIRTITDEKTTKELPSPPFMQKRRSTILDFPRKKPKSLLTPIPLIFQ